MFLLLCALSSPALAGALSYDDALRMAQEANPDIEKARADVSSAEGSLMMTRGAWDPYLGANAGQSVGVEKGRFQGVGFTTDSAVVNWSADLSQNLPTGTSWSASWTNQRIAVDSEFAGLQQTSLDFETRLSASLSQQLLKGHRFSYNMESVRNAEASLSIAEASLLQQRQSVLSQVASSYWNLAYAAYAADVAQESVDVATEEKRVVEAMVAAGVMAPIEVTRVEAALAQTRINLIEAKNTYASASDALAVQLGLPVGDLIEPLTPPGEVPMGVDISTERAVQSALEGNPALQIQRVSVENAELQLVNAQHARLPTLALSASAGLQGRVSDQDEDSDGTYGSAVGEMLSGDYRNRYVGMDFSMPLAMRVERGRVQSRAAAVDRAEVELRQQEAVVAQQVASYVRTIETARQKLQLAELNLRLADETLAAEKARQEAGRAIEKDVLEAQTNLDNAKVSLMLSRTEFQQAVVELLALQGKL
ncbi:MAG: TolC family protein [Alphaproteobacteria bacterium]|nr:TolC family protein [Alphaproteobacteria bacterium]